MSKESRKPRSPSVAKIRVVSDGNGTIRLVRAKTDSAAIDHCTKPWTSHLATTEEAIKYTEAGIKVEEVAPESAG